MAIGTKSRGPGPPLGETPADAASLTATGKGSVAGLNIGSRDFAWVRATSGTAAAIEAQRPLLQHPCCCATIGADVQQIDNVIIASATMAPIAIRRIHVRLFTGTT